METQKVWCPGSHEKEIFKMERGPDTTEVPDTGMMGIGN